ncbi:uncharacterized protein LOC134230834 [Saccostrea cucullata]|uniref:uncharacterized protein LOC134230834 n=1 Tax=Saccostrea cuccullata TaxID=36930 RepID=UPI002ED525E3
MSESVFAGLCHKVGTSTQINIRREVEDIREIVRNELVFGRGDYLIWSGSYREGFRLEGSDVDLMKCFSIYQVVWDLNQAMSFNINRKWLFLCDCSESPPGFTLLAPWPMMAIQTEVPTFFVRINGKVYISSSKYRRIACPLGVPKNFTEHGPCQSGYLGDKEYDFALCFECKFWPPSASSWIDRCQIWPQSHILHNIVKNGCHLVAIGHKLGKHADDEWRISFSLAELKLVYSMNHCQFLTYGLLKIFLKEIIHSALGDQDKLLCSYHMKTSVFWVIQQNIIAHWCPQNLLEAFWVCFKLLLKWVYEGVCPNFFIPENNMFVTNIHGEAQKILFLRLYGLYENGIACLLHSPTIRPYLINVLRNPRQSICIHEYNLVSEHQLDFELFNVISKTHLVLVMDLRRCIKCLSIIEYLIGLRLTQYQFVLLQKSTVNVLQTISFLLLNRCYNTVANKLMYKVDKKICHMLSLAAKFGCISDTLYLVMYYYRTARYLKALFVNEMMEVKLSQPHVLYRIIDPVKYSEAIGGQSLSTKLRQATADDIDLPPEICYLHELIPEQSVLQNGNIILAIPLFTLVYMLEILCSMHTDTVRAQRALLKLKSLVHFDQGVYLPEKLKGISWQILGICQQITGDIHSALFSYQQSLRQYPYHELRTATLMRIQDIMRTSQRENM